MCQIYKIKFQNLK